MSKIYRICTLMIDIVNLINSRKYSNYGLTPPRMNKKRAMCCNTSFGEGYGVVPIEHSIVLSETPVIINVSFS